MFLKFSTKNKSRNELFNIYDKEFRRSIILSNIKKKINFIQLNNQIQMIIYRKKFKNNVKNEFIRYNDNIKNMKNLIKISIEFDDKFYEKIMKKHYNSREKSNIYVETLSFRDNNSKN